MRNCAVRGVQKFVYTHEVSEVNCTYMFLPLNALQLINHGLSCVNKLFSSTQTSESVEVKF
jgi:hypothetical protein